jgi:hypothetical protein
VTVTTLVPPEGFEPSTSRSGGARSNPLSYEGNGRSLAPFTAPPHARPAAANGPPYAAPAMASMPAASSMSLRVSPPALCVVKVIVTLL